MIKFLLNNKVISTDLPAGNLLVDFIRYNQNLKGTKIGCREGDCGACVVLIGEIKNGELEYQTLTSCLTPLANINNKHVVTIEGINMQGLNPIQQAMTDESATQCGFCTPGFVMSLAGFCLSKKSATPANALASIDGNICRCTGYKSIERAAVKISNLFSAKTNEEPTKFNTVNNILPPYFSDVREKLNNLTTESNGNFTSAAEATFISGGTDLYVQKHDELKTSLNRFLFNHEKLKGIYQEGSSCVIGGSATVTDLQESPLMNQYFPRLQEYAKLISSTPIRNIATVAGNFINASPIGDLTIFFLALDAIVLFDDGTKSREVPLRKLFRGYKVLDKAPGEYIQKIWFQLPSTNTRFHFEKVSKRRYLDIASVNSAISIRTEGDIIEEARISAGGVGPVPLYLERTVSYMQGKSLNENTVNEAIEVAQSEIRPISDVRGTETYKRLLLGQLIRAHFFELFGLVPSWH